MSTVELKACYNVRGRYYFKRNGLLCTFGVLAAAMLDVGQSPKGLRFVQRSEAYP